MDVDTDSTTDATRVLMVLSCITYIVAIGLYLLVVVRENMSMKFLALVLFLAVLFEFIAMSLYTDYYKDTVKVTTVNWGWTYGVAWSCPILTLVPAIMCFFDKRTDTLTESS